MHFVAIKGSSKYTCILKVKKKAIHFYTSGTMSLFKNTGLLFGFSYIFFTTQKLFRLRKNSVQINY